MPLWLRRATRERLGYLLEAVAREVVEQSISVAGSRLKQKIKSRILRSAPRDAFLTRRFLRGGDIEVEPKCRPTDSVQSRDATMPRRGLAGVTGRRIVVFHDADRAGCFTADTLILMADGSQKPISLIQAGEYVSVPKGRARVVRSWHNGTTDEWYRVSAGGRSVVCTGNHPFFVEGRGWVSIENLVHESVEVDFDGRLHIQEEIEGAQGLLGSKASREVATAGRQGLAVPEVRGRGVEHDRHRRARRVFSAAREHSSEEGWDSSSFHENEGLSHQESPSQDGRREQSTLEGWRLQRSGRGLYRQQLPTAEAVSCTEREAGEPVRMVPEGSSRGLPHRDAPHHSFSLLAEPRRVQSAAAMSEVPQRDGQALFGTGRTTVRIERMSRTAQSKFDLEIEDVHCYYANGFLVHNSHLEAYIEVDGVAHNVGVKRLTPQMVKKLDIRRNGGGRLTRATQQRMLRLWASEFELGKGRWLGQSTDHEPHEARMEWESRERGVEGYGAGEMRQVLADDSVVVRTTGKALEWRDPKIDKHHDAFAYVAMDKGDKRSRSVISVGLKRHPSPPEFHKLKLGMHQDIGKFLRKLGLRPHLHKKEDGASGKCRGDRRGTQVWAPRVSKTSGEQINYSWKLRDWFTVKFDEPTEFKGEILMHKQLKSGRERQLSAAQIGGYLNSDKPLPPDIRVEYVIYSVDKVGRTDARSMAHTDQLALIRKIAKKHKDWRPATPVEADPKAIAHVCKTGEGVVGVPRDGSIADDGLKLKIRGDTHDWRVESVDLEPGPRGRGDIAGTITFRSLKSGRLYKLGPSAMGGRSRQIAMMSLGNRMRGRVFKVASQNGHEGRASKVLEEHPCKGLVE